jgi:hypothetical protein
LRYVLVDEKDAVIGDGENEKREKSLNGGRERG